MTNDPATPEVPAWADRSNLDEPVDADAAATTHHTLRGAQRADGSDKPRPASGGASIYPQSDTTGNLEPEFQERWKSYAQSTKIRWMAILAILLVVGLIVVAFRAGANSADRRDNERRSRAAASVSVEFSPLR